MSHAKLFEVPTSVISLFLSKPLCKTQPKEQFSVIPSSTLREDISLTELCAGSDHFFPQNFLTCCKYAINYGVQ